jgi:hypothetical protein
MDMWERLYIFLENSNDSEVGYNMTEGGDNLPSQLGIKRTEESKKKMSISKTGSNHPYYGKNLSQEHIDNISNGRKGIVFSEEHKKNLSLAHSGKNNPNYGKPRTDETKEKISIGNKGKIFTEEHRKNMSKPRINTDNMKKKRTSTDNMKKPKSEEHKQNMRKPKSEEHKKKISEFQKGRIKTPETIEKLRKAAKNQWIKQKEGE